MFFYLPTVNAVFLHMPKTGGLSIRKRLWPEAETRPMPHLGYWDADEIPGHWPMGRCFAFVRHPLDRFVSACKYTRTGPRHMLRVLREYDGAPFPPCKYTEHGMPQTHPCYRLDLAQWVGRFEQYADEVRRLAEWLGADVPDRVPHVNQSHHRPWQDEIPPGLVDELVEFYANDFDQLGYGRPEGGQSGPSS